MTTKLCFKCNEEKDILSFHKHSAMKDGRLNKCASCVVKDVALWRTKNKDCRKNEYKKTTTYANSKRWDEHVANLKANAKGRRAVVSEYDAKRRIKTDKFKMTDFDLFVLSEAGRLCEIREKITGTPWHIDHIVPLNHKHVSGLHNGYNVQVVPGNWNIKKGNRNMDIYFNIG